MRKEKWITPFLKQKGKGYKARASNISCSSLSDRWGRFRHGALFINHTGMHAEKTEKYKTLNSR